MMCSRKQRCSIVKHDLLRLHHMLDAAEEIIQFSKNKTRKDLDSDRKLNLAIVHLLEIIGEAANGLSVELQKKYSDVPWHVMVSMRNRLIHGYFDIDLDIVWKTTQNDIPKLTKTLKKIISEEE